MPAKIALTMIVRNEAENLPRCLASTAGLFDETIVVDTGSVDRTREIARAFGARVFDFPWCDDFSAPRNVALEHATGDYAFWIDADNIVDPGPRRKLAALFRGLDSAPYVGAYRFRHMISRVDPADPDGLHWSWQSMHLFPNRPDIRWRFRIHERIEPAVCAAGLPWCETDIQLRHTGYDDPSAMPGKLARNDRLLALELAERPGDPYVLLLEARRLMRLGDAEGALAAALEGLAAPMPPGLFADETRGGLAAALVACDAARSIRRAS